jgi:transcriptional/translational regulatory protein YebC/TACO1
MKKIIEKLIEAINSPAKGGARRDALQEVERLIDELEAVGDVDLVIEDQEISKNA